MYAITDKCTGCHACKLVCPKNAVVQLDQSEKIKFKIQSHRCNGCAELFDSPQCASICPIEEAILCNGVPVNPLGSLSPSHHRSSEVV
ncbi:4Fe-4S dicluster domain-containing protein [Vibrio sp. 10N.286.49.B3]|uniref:4Fe-4S dicluster domain-containing protein n=1 Tax=Vibrio sp. 10N.286.49.B3 TaxID=1880855 RepID=UPI000C818F57|nr:4Fe-4S dicluster domain-containing protein [Vibrio sp. 10N.286.49.B3]